nr:MAG TPA: hypothetical protein [Caudoviricetes sp.]
MIFQNVSIQSRTSQPHLIKRKRPSENLFRRPSYTDILPETFAKSPPNPLNSHPRHLGDFS